MGAATRWEVTGRAFLGGNLVDSRQQGRTKMNEPTLDTLMQRLIGRDRKMKKISSISGIAALVVLLVLVPMTYG